jgi:SAM-dependent methyltransferase
MSWEDLRSWDSIRPLVYFLAEDFIPAAMAFGRDVLDFSAGLGDLSRYLLESGAASVTATTPDASPPEGTEGVSWLTGVAAGNIAEHVHGASFDLIAARMVFQFPTWEGDRADPDTMAEEFGRLLRPGGRLVLAFHQFEAFESLAPGKGLESIDRMLDEATGRLADLARVVRFLGLPPREGPSGETGFGLKVPMLVTTLQSRGYSIEVADHPEPFTFPLGIEHMSESELESLGARVMEIKRRHLADLPIDPYQRPEVVRRMLDEIGELMDFVTWPIVRIVARLAE